MARYEFKSLQFSASDVVDRRIKDYAVDVAIHKLPNIVDGLKVIHRRILWVMYLNQMFSDKNLLNSAMGKIIEVHPVGDQSINDACTRMTQDFSMGLRLLKARGNSGSYGMAKAGAPRYLHVGIDDLAKEIFFDNVNIKTIPMITGEDCITLEPKYFIPRLPTSLLVASFTVGVGIKSDIFPMYLDNVCELVKKYAEHEATKNGPIKMDYSKLGKYFVPDIPINNIIKNTNDLIESYQRGEFNKTIYIDSDVDIYRNSIVIKTIPYGQSFPDMVESLKKLARDKKSWLADILTGFHNGQNDKKIGNVKLTFKSTKDIFEIFRKLQPIIKYSSSITPLYNYISKHENVIEMDPPSLLDVWYNERRASILGGIKYDQETESRLLREKEVKLKVCDHTDEIIDIIRNKSHTTQEALEMLQNKFELSYNQANILYNTRIGMLNQQSEQEIKEDIAKHREKCKQLRDNAINVHEVIYKDAEYFQKKYKKQRICKIDDYKGCVVVNNKDIVQWDTVADACKLLSEFHDAKVYTYPDKHTYKYLYPNSYRASNKYSNISKITQGSMIFSYTNDNYYTLWIRNNKPVVTEGIGNNLLDDEEGKIMLPITSKFYGIDLKGHILKCKVSDLIVRKSTNRTKVDYKLLYGIPYYSQGLALVYVNDQEPDQIHIVKIDENTKKILISPLGTTVFIGFVPLHSNTEYLFNCPDIVKGNYKYIDIKDIDSIIDDKATNVTITISRKLKRNDSLREMVEL